MCVKTTNAFSVQPAIMSWYTDWSEVTVTEETRVPEVAASGRGSQSPTLVVSGPWPKKNAECAGRLFVTLAACGCSDNTPYFTANLLFCRAGLQSDALGTFVRR